MATSTTPPPVSNPVVRIEADVATIIEAERTKRQRLVADQIDRNIDYLQAAAAGAARRYRVDPADVLSQGKVNLLLYSGRFDESRPFLPWACKVLRNAAVKEVLNARRQPQLAPIEDLGSVTDAHARRPDQDAGTNDLLALVDAWAATHLSRPHFASWTLWRDGYSDTEAAAWLSVPRGTHSKRVSRSNSLLAHAFAASVDFGKPRTASKSVCAPGIPSVPVSTLGRGTCSRVREDLVERRAVAG